MTSSLVGSEMCIRDRLGAGAVNCQQILQVSMICGVTFRTFCGTPATDKICLLYTSDAADDM
eukprot:1110341-Prorocentrum_lima.AAC.1